MSIGMIDAIAGGGKTSAIIKHAVVRARQNKGRICICLPTNEVIEEKYEEACELANGLVPVYRVHSDIPGCLSVGATLHALLTSIGTNKPAVLFVTHKTFNDCPNWIGRQNWKFYVDELYDPIEHVPLRLPHNHAILTDLLELVTPNDVFSEVRIASGSRRAFTLMRDGSDDVDAVFEPITARLAQPERWRVYIETANYSKVTSDIGRSRLIDQREQAASLHFWAVQLPWFEKEGLDVTMASACFTDRLIYKLWHGEEASFVQDRDVMSNLLATTHNGAGLQLHCMNIEHWSAWAKSGGPRGKIPTAATAQHALETLIGTTYGHEPFIYNANSDWKRASMWPNGEQIGVVSHGKNAYSHYNNVAFMPSLLPVPYKWRFLLSLGFSDDDIRTEYYHTHAYQTVFRSAARQQHVRSGIVKAVLPGRAACEYIQRKAPGAEIIVHDVLSARRERGRPVKHASEAEAKAANALRMRAKRQSDKAKRAAASVAAHAKAQQASAASVVQRTTLV